MQKSARIECNSDEYIYTIEDENLLIGFTMVWAIATQSMSAAQHLFIVCVM